MTELQLLAGVEINPFVEHLAGLRIRVFREYPYLYDGDLDYESAYLARLAESKRSIVVLVRKGEKIVGASTALPLADADELFQAPFSEPDKHYYFGESVLLPAYRGRGIGHAFFDYRERVARDYGYPRVSFCAVVRPDDHARKPAGYRDLSSFWRKRGYEVLEGCDTRYSWKDLDDERESEKVMRFWGREL